MSNRIIDADGARFSAGCTQRGTYKIGVRAAWGPEATRPPASRHHARGGHSSRDPTSSRRRPRAHHRMPLLMSQAFLPSLRSVRAKAAKRLLTRLRAARNQGALPETGRNNFTGRRETAREGAERESH